MKLHELSPKKSAKSKRTRVGRGIGSGLGKTSGRGSKGQKARSGGGVRRGFEGGQMPLSRRLPKRGFTNIFKKEVAIINIEDLADFSAGTVVTLDLLKEKNLIKTRNTLVKLLGEGEINNPLTVKVHQVSKSALEKIASAGGKVEVI